MIDTDRLWEKLYPAAWKLARSADPIHDRIGEAFRGFRDLKGEEFPPEARIGLPRHRRAYDSGGCGF